MKAKTKNATEKKKSSPPSKSEKVKASNASHQQPPAVVSRDSESSYIVPNHSFDVHVKRKEFIVEAQLHRIPEKFIDVEVEADRVTVSTLRFTKKFKLDVAMPSDVEPDVLSASSTLDHSTLRVIVPLKNLAPTYVERVEAIQAAQKNARQLRFGQTHDGNLKMRVKKVVVAPGKKKPTKRSREAGEVDDDDDDDDEAILTSTKSHDTTKTNLRKKQKGSGTAKAYESEKTSMLQLMRDVAQETQQKAAEKQERLEKLQRLRTERLMTRRECIKEREEKKHSAYHKILSEKKSHLQRMVEHNHVEPLVVHRVKGSQGPKASSDEAQSSARRKGKRVSWASDAKL